MKPTQLVHHSENQEIAVTDSIKLNQIFLRLFRRLQLSVTWEPINNSSYDISLFLFSLYLQQSIIYVLQFLSLCRTTGYYTTKQHNIKHYRVISHVPFIHPNPPFHTCLPYEVACSEGYIPMTALTHTSPPLPHLKAREYDFRNATDWIQEASDKKPGRKWDTDSLWRAVTNYTQHLQDFLIRI